MVDSVRVPDVSPLRRAGAEPPAASDGGGARPRTTISGGDGIAIRRRIIIINIIIKNIVRQIEYFTLSASYAVTIYASFA